MESGALRTRRSTLNALVGLCVLLVVLASSFAFPLVSAEGASSSDNRLVVYSGRNETLVGPLIERFSDLTGIQVSVRYGGTAELAATILEEGKNTPADVFFAQDGGALGALAAASRLQKLPEELLQKVDPMFRSSEGLWIGASGRARVIAYNVDKVNPAELPDSIWGLTDPKWQGQVGWAPTNASFQAFVSALRVLEGDERARAWLQAMKANGARAYRNNVLIVDAVGRGEVSLGLVNHYYLFRFLAERGETFPVRHHYTRGDAGALVNVAGAGILDTSRRRAQALAFLEFLVSEEAQRYFVEQTREYPVAHTDALELHPMIRPLSEIEAPDLDLENLEDLQGTLDMLLELGVL